MNALLQFNIEDRKNTATWEEALRKFINQVDSAGIMVMVSGIVGGNTRRKLNPEEFRGFALSEKRAPLIFLNGADTKSGQMFTLAHELAHIWLGETGVSDVTPEFIPTNKTEIWCNKVAAEMLVPTGIFKAQFNSSNELSDEYCRLAKVFKVSTLVIIRRIFDCGFITENTFQTVYNSELKRLLEITKSKGGNYYLTQPARVSKRFARALIVSTLEGQTLYREAFHLLGLKKLSTFNELGARLGVG